MRDGDKERRSSERSVSAFQFAASASASAKRLFAHIVRADPECPEVSPNVPSQEAKSTISSLTLQPHPSSRFPNSFDHVRPFDSHQTLLFLPTRWRRPRRLVQRRRSYRNLLLRSRSTQVCESFRRRRARESSFPSPLTPPCFSPFRPSPRLNTPTSVIVPTAEK